MASAVMDWDRGGRINTSTSTVFLATNDNRTKKR